MKIHALWCHPRSVSTAFERIMRERGDLEVLHEPFMYDYYLNQSANLFPDFEPAPDHPTTFDGIQQMILQRSEKAPVFFKDMAYYVGTALPDNHDFATQMSHCFLIRDPAESIVSYYYRDPNFSLHEVGIEAQFRLYQSLCELGTTPLIITADELRADARATLRKYWQYTGLPYVDHAFEWDSTVPPGWEAVKNWHSNALNSGTIQKPKRGRDVKSELIALGPAFVDYDTHHRPFYQALKQLASHQ